MRRLAVLVLALTACQPTEPAAPAVEAATAAIRNGTREPQLVPLSPGQVLALGWLHDAGRAGRNFCSGTLIAPRYVATARHCIEGRSARTVGFGLGLLPSDPAASFAVDAIFAHPQVDAAVLRLAADAVAEVPDVVPIAYNREAPWEGLVGSEVEAGGYGETYDPSREGRYFAVVLLERFSDDFVHVDGRGRQGICFGDSGGPVMTVNPAGEVVVLGVESSGDSSCVGRDQLTRLDAIAPWIQAIVEGGEPENLCGDLDALGRCDGPVAEWCEGGMVRRQDCEQRGQVCDFIDETVGFYCTEPPPCGAIDARGLCDGEQVVRCRFGRLATEDCARQGEVCRTDSSGAFCGAAPPDAGSPDAGSPDAALPDAALPDLPDTGSPDPADAAPADGATDTAPREAERAAHSDGCQGQPGAPTAPLAGLALVALLGWRQRKGSKSKGFRLLG